MLSMLRVENSPFNESELKRLRESIGALRPDQSQWLSGYLAGRLAGQGDTAVHPDPHTANTSAPVFHVIYATETGHSENIAEALSDSLQQQGINTRLQSMDALRPASLKKLEHVAFVISTHGEGDPPDESLELFEYLESDRAPSLKQLNYRILALGDKSYQYFCEAGRRLDKNLQSLGARAIAGRVECDVDYQPAANVFSDEVIQYTRENLSDTHQSSNASANHLSLVHIENRWSRDNPFEATLIQSQRISGDDSDKEVYHLELSLEDSDIQYQAGDALAVWAPNDPLLVDSILISLDIDPASPVNVNGQQMAVRDSLINHVEITRLSGDVIRDYADKGQQASLAREFADLDAGQQQDFVEQRQLADLVDEYPATLTAQALIDTLPAAKPRSYSIASSQEQVDDEVHLTIATLRSNATGSARTGVASGYMNHRIESGEKIKVFLEPNTRFRLPEDPDAPVIMVAAGTGIAPFRAFMQTMEERDSNNNAWLIFGNPHLRHDFLYQREWLRWRNNGQLKRIDTAWSRDQQEKRYVQHVIAEQAERLDRWLSRGAHIYICGSLAMGQAVQTELQNSLAELRGIESVAAPAILKELKQQKRLKKDLY